MEYFQKQLQSQFNNRVKLQEKRPGVHQLLAPLYHEDGDMVDVFLEWTSPAQETIRICDYGLTLMRLSYSYEIDTVNKTRIFERILLENGVNENDGNIFLEVKPESLYPGILQFSQVVAKVSNMSYFKREVIRSLFYEMLGQYIEDSLQKYNPLKNYYPISDRDELEVDYKFDMGKRPIYLFGIKDYSKSRLVTISCLEFIRAQIPFRSVAVLEDSEDFGRKDRDRLTSAIDKQFPSLDDLMENGEKYFERERSAA